ncbi:hypothetical protein LTR53_015435, partial [Teratosphaeriaceae sp. CCFEE 6253]
KEDKSNVSLSSSIWVKRYETFFRTLVFASNISVQRCRLDPNADLALGDVEGVMTTAEHYGSVQTLRPAFKSWTTDWNSSKSLFPAIAARPREWLILAIKVRSKLVYDEGFVHLAGQYPTRLSNVPLEVKDLIISTSRNLRYLRYDIDKQVDNLTFGTENKAGSRAPGKAIVGQSVAHPVDIEWQSDLWALVNIWRDCKRVHLKHIDADQDQLPDDLLCEHATPEHAPHPACLTLAGLYRTLHRGGEAYLPVEKVVAKMKRAQFDPKPATVRQYLALLKLEARRIVAPLMESGLQLDGRERLGYLTCGQVGREAPWPGEDLEEEEEGEEDVEMG